MAVKKLVEIGGAAAGILLMLAFLAIPVLLLFGAAEFSVWALEWIPDIVGIAVAACILFVPFALIPAARSFASGFYGLVSLAFGVCLWLYSLAFTYLEWGMIAVIFGVLLAGVGVVFTGILAALFSASWGALGNIAFLFGLFFGTSFLGSWLGNSAERRLERRRAQEVPSEVIITQPHRE